MRYLSIFLICPLWGTASTLLFFYGWTSFLGIIACAIGLNSGRVSRRTVLLNLFNHLTLATFCAVVLAAGFFILFNKWELGRTMIEMLVYWLGIIVGLVFVFPRAISTINRICDGSMGPDDPWD